MTEKPYFHLCIVLANLVPEPVWPQGVALSEFQQNMIAPIHALLSSSYEATGDVVLTLDEWWAALSGDDEYDPAVIFPVIDKEGHVIAFAQCWSSGFIKDIVVHPRWRRHGLGEALLLQCFKVFKARGIDKSCLKVEQNNPFGAEKLYRRLGMTDF